MVVGGDSCSDSHGFKFQHHVLEGYFSYYIAVKIVMFEKTETN